jgi:hypothetical protein
MPANLPTATGDTPCVAPSFERIADVWLTHVRDRDSAWFGVNASAFLERLPPPGPGDAKDAAAERWARVPLFLHARAVKR